MEGFDKEWIRAGNTQYARYTNVHPGEYVFMVKGSNNDGVWNEEGASVAIVIAPPFWETWWFRLLAVAAIVGALAGAYKYRVSKLLEMERMRIRIASDLHDDIGSNLSGIALINEMISSRSGVGDQERQQLLDASRSARSTADALKDIVWIIDPDHDKLDDITLRMKDAAARLLVNIDYSFHCDTRTSTDALSMEFRRNIFLIYKEILNNIVKHARATRVVIEVTTGHNLFHLKVVDNGIGFDAGTVQRGNGLTNLRNRAAKLGGTIQVKSCGSEGTTVELAAVIP
jgi:signal transduction histidine kinase